MILEWIAPILLFLAEALAIGLTWRASRLRKVAAVLGAYAVIVGLCAAFGFIQPDEFGFGLIPLLTVTSPWMLAGLSVSYNLISMLLGAVLMAALLVLLARLVEYAGSSALRAKDATPHP